MVVSAIDCEMYLYEGVSNRVMTELSIKSTPESSTGQLSSQGSTPVVAVVTAVAEVADADPLELPPLRNAVDPDALNDLVGTECNRLTSISFEYIGYDVTITGDGNIRVASIA
jgi:hypothetical protein